MAFTKKSTQDHFQASFGQESETAQASKDGLTVGGVYNSTPPTIANGEFSRLQVDASGNLMTNIAAGEVIAVSAGTITAGTTDLLKAGTVTSVEGGTIETNPLYTSYLGTITIATSDTTQDGTLAVAENGLVRRVTVTTPDMEGTGTATVKMVDASGGTVIGLAAQDESTVTSYGTVEPMTSSMEWVATADGTQSTDADIVIEVHYEGA